MMIENMREATPGTGMFNSQRMKMYRGMFDHQLALTLASGKRLGIAEMLTRQLGNSKE